MNGFPYGTTAQYEDSASTTHINFSVTWESWEESCSFSSEQSSDVISSLLSRQILLRQPNWGKASDQPLTLTTQRRPLSLLQLSKTLYLSTKPHSVSFHWVSISLVSFNQAPPQYLSTGRRQVPATPPNKTQDHQLIREIREPGKTYPNLSGLSEEAVGCKGPLLVPRLRFLVEFRWRREVHSRSLRGHHNCWQKNAQHENCELSFILGKMRTAAPETVSQIALRNCSKEAGGKVSICVILVKREYMQSSTHFFVEGFF